VPSGAYRFDDGTVEEFQCAPGPAGWRYVGTTSDGGRMDVAVNLRWRPARVELVASGWLLRGGISGPDVVWLRAAVADLAGAVERRTAATGFFGRSPGLLVATARSLRLVTGGSVRVRLIEVSEPVLATRTVDLDWTLLEVIRHDAEGEAALPVEHYRVIEVATGLATDLHLCGDVVLAGPGLELHALHSPPTEQPTQEETRP